MASTIRALEPNKIAPLDFTNAAAKGSVIEQTFHWRPMMSGRLPDSSIHPKAKQKMADFHAATVKEVDDAVKSAPVVVVGMAQNPFV